MKMIDFYIGVVFVLAIVGYVLYRCLLAWYLVLGGGAPVRSQRHW